MQVSKIPALLTLAVALLLGGVPWSACAHGADGHVRVYVLDAHGHELEGRAACHDHAGSPADRHACAQGHAPGQDCPEGDGHCHCEDGRLLTSRVPATAPLSAPSVCGVLPAPRIALPIAAQTLEVAPSRGSGRGRAHEEDPNVLLR